MKTNTHTPDLLQRMDACWRAANYQSVGQIYLFDNPLLKMRRQRRRQRRTESPGYATAT